MHAVSAVGNELKCDRSLTLQETLCLRKMRQQALLQFSVNASKRNLV